MISYFWANPKANYETGILNVDNKYYIYRNYIIESLPLEYQNLQMIKTANDDKNKTDLDFHFELSKSSKVFVAYDPRLSTPSWIQDNYSFTGNSIQVSDSGPDSLIVWEKLSESGVVTLGDNESTTPQSSMYFVFCKETPLIKLSCKVFLEGPFNADTMMTSLNDNEYIPLSQPFNKTPWNYEGNESVENIPNGVVDWILIELRNESDNSFIEARRACFLLSDGRIVDTNGSSPVQFLIKEGNYFIVVKHRNHLGVMSSEAVLINN